MGTFFTRAARSTQAVLIGLLLVLPTTIAGVISHPARASADGVIGGSGDGTRFIVQLSGAAQPSNYTITGKNANGQTTSFKFLPTGLQKGDPPQFYSDPVPWGDNTSCILGSTTQNTANEFSWTFTASGGGAGQKIVDYCGVPPDATNQLVLVTIPVTDGASSAKGNVAGRITYAAGDGTAQPYGNDATVQIKTADGKTSISVPIKSGSVNSGGCTVGTGGVFSVPDLAPGSYILTGNYDTPQADSHGDTGKAVSIANTPFTITANKTTCLNLTATVGGSNPAPTDNDKTLNCGGGAFNWVICPFILMASSAAETLDSFIMNTLNIDVQQIFDNANTKGTASNGYYTAWSSFRVLATALLIIAGLIMVASQALGFEFLDAYTIRKTLPRLLVAVIGITLSWPLMRFMVNFFDVIGVDIRELIYHPFSQPPFSTTISAGGGILTTLGVTAGILILGPASLTILVTILISVFVGFLALVIREIAIIMLIVLAPIAIACYILPNTQKMWKLWHENFIGLLAAFPLISAVIAAGKVFAAVAITTGTSTTGSLSRGASALVGGITGHSFMQHEAAAAANNIGSLTAQGVAIFAWYAPYLLIGKLITMTTGAISTLAGGAGGFLNGVSKRMSARRSDAASRNLAAMKAGNRFKGDSLAARAFNSTTKTIGAIPEAGFNPRQMRARMRSATSTREMTESAEYGEKSAAFSKIKPNEDYLQAGVEGGGDDNKVRSFLSNKGYKGRALDDAVADIRAARREVSSDVFEQAAVQQMAATGTAFKAQYDDATGDIVGGGAGEMHEWINRAAGKDRLKAARMLGAMRAGAGRARPDLAGGSYSDQLKVLNAQYEGSGNFAPDADGKTTTAVQAASRQIARAAYLSQSGSSASMAKPSAIKAMASEANAQLNERIDAHQQALSAAPAADREVQVAEREVQAAGYGYANGNVAEGTYRAAEAKLAQAQRKATDAQRRVAETDDAITGALVDVNGLYSSMGNSSPEARAEMAAVTARKVDVRGNGETRSVQELMDDRRNNPVWLARNKEFGRVSGGGQGSGGQNGGRAASAAAAEAEAAAAEAAARAGGGDEQG